MIFATCYSSSIKKICKPDMQELKHVNLNY